MSERNQQIFFSLGDLSFNLCGDTAEDLASEMSGLAVNAASIFDSYVTIKQAGLAAEVFSQGRVTSPSTQSAPSVPAAQKAKNNSGPPAEGGPECPHGPLKDCEGSKTAQGAPYKYRWYCTGKGKDACSFDTLKELGVR